MRKMKLSLLLLSTSALLGLASCGGVVNDSSSSLGDSSSQGSESSLPSSSEASKRYAITLEVPEGVEASLSAKDHKAEEGEKVTLSFKVKDETKVILALSSEDVTLESTLSEDRLSLEASFTMPAKEVRLSLTLARKTRPSPCRNSATTPQASRLKA